MTETSLLIANEKLRKAEQEIVTLRRLVDYTVAIIVASGGRVEIPVEKIDDYSKCQWRHENDGKTHVFSAAGEIA